MNKKPAKSPAYVACGFGLVIFLLIVIIVLWKYNEYIREQHFKRLEQHQFEYRAIEKLIHNAHLRANTLYMMTTLHDPFELDEAYLKFQKHGENLMKHRDTIVSSNLDEEENAIWNNIKDILNNGYRSQYKVIGLINQGSYAEASKKIASVVSPIQEALQAKLDELLSIKDTRLKQAKHEAKKTDFIIDIFIYLLSFICIILGILTIIVTRRTVSTEFALATQGRRIRSLYEVASQSHDSFDAQIEDTLKVGCQIFNLDIGKLCQINEKRQINKILNVVLPENLNTSLKKNIELPLERTFCSIPFQENRLVLIDKIATSKYKSYPCVEFANLGAYIAAPIYVFGEKFGTINFSSFKARTVEFDEDDHDLLYLIGKFISVILETKISQEMAIEKKASDDANVAKSRFLSSMSHELRTPLNAIIGYSELLLSSDSVLDENTTNDIHCIHKAGFHLLHLVNNVLDISKVEAGKMTVDPENIDLDDFIANIVDLVTPLVRERNNTLSVDCEKHDLRAFTDNQKLKQILLNLIGNAAKFTQDGEIVLSAKTIATEADERLVFSVRDNGVGMSEAVQETIFSEFVQDRSNNLTYQNGTGLGLCICRSFCHLLGGDIGVTSRLGEGSEFTVSIPLTFSTREKTTLPAAAQAVASA